ncbi:MAG: hypothetical protein WA974_04655, partial [Thermodesulfobacteriota bacterium]
FTELIGITRKREMDEAEAREQKRALEEILSVYTLDHRFKAADIRWMHKIWLGGSINGLDGIGKSIYPKGPSLLPLPEEFPI